MNVEMKYINTLEVFNCNFVVMVDIKVLQKVLYIHIVHFIWHVKVLKDQLNYVLDFFSSQVSVVSLIENIEQHPDWHDNLFEFRLLWGQCDFQGRRVVGDGNFSQDKSQLADSLKVFSCQVPLVRNVIIKKKIIDILLSNWIVQTELSKNLGEDFSDLKTCQMTFVTPVILGEESFDGDIDGSGFFGLGSC